MTADEALKLSPTGFIWDESGRCAYQRFGYIWYWVDGEAVHAVASHNWHPEPPSLREKQEATPTEIDELRAENAKLKAELEKQLASKKPKLKRRPLSEPPRSATAVLVYIGVGLMGKGYWTYEMGWSFYFPYREGDRDSYHWTELPEVE